MGNKKYLVIFSIIIVLAGTVFFVNPLEHLMAKDDVAGRIAYVDVQKVFNMHPDKSSAEKQLNQEAQSMQVELEKKASDVSKEEQQQMLSDYQQKLSQKEQEMIQGILQKVDKAIKEVARDKSVKVVLKKKNVIYGGYNLTQEVIDYIKAQEKQEEQKDENENNNKAEEAEENSNQ